MNLLGLERDVPICDWWPSEFRVSRLDSIAAVGLLIPVAILVAVLMALLQMLWIPIAISALWRHDVPGWWRRFAARSLAMLERPTEFVLLGRWESSRRLVEYTPIDYTDALAWPGDGSPTVAPSVPPA